MRREMTVLSWMWSFGGWRRVIAFQTLTDAVIFASQSSYPACVIEAQVPSSQNIPLRGHAVLYRNPEAESIGDFAEKLNEVRKSYG